MLVIEHPPRHDALYRHAVELVLRWAGGFATRVEVGAGPDYVVRVVGAEGRLIVPDVFLRAATEAWLAPATLPPAKVSVWDAPAEFPNGEAGRLASLPRLFDTSTAADDRLPIDVFGAAFYFATRYEEAARPARDRHDRMPGSEATASTLDILERPIIHEYAELLLRALQRFAPGLSRPHRQFRVLPSHDVDEAFRWKGVHLHRLARSVGGSLLRRQPLRAADQVRRWLAVKRGALARDPYFTYARLMDESERRGLRSTFFFVADGSTGYRIDDPAVVDILRAVSRRGHEIGLHAAYETYRDRERTERELQGLRRACARAGITLDQVPNRQHVLRWDPRRTPANLAALGFSYDATLGFAERIGFRTGLCVDHPAFDLERREVLRLYHRPLVVMDATLTEPRYMGLPKRRDAIARAVATCRAAARAHGGDLGVLWHNSRLESETDWEIYAAVLDG